MTEQPRKAGVDLSRVRAAIEPVLSARGVALVEVEWLTEHAGWTLRLTIERENAAPQGPGSAPAESGVTLEDCADVSRDVSAILDVEEDLIAPHYRLEVSSPGLDRPLRTPADFARFAGRLAKVKLARPAPDGQRVLRGTLEATAPDAVAVIVDGKRIEAPFADVVEANLVFELGAAPKKSATSTKKSSSKGPRAGQAGGITESSSRGNRTSS